MSPTPLLIAALLISATLTEPCAAAPNSDRAQRIDNCRKQVTRVEKFELLRRKGGSVSQMESWKRQMRKAQAEYSRLDCKRLRRSL